MCICLCVYVYMYLVAFGEDGGRQSKSTLPSPSTSSSGYPGLSHIVNHLITQMNPHRTVVFSPHKCEKQGSGRWRALMQGCRGELKLETSSLPTSRSFSREQLVQRRGKCEAGTHLSLWKQKDQPHSLPSESAQFSWVPMSVFVWCSAMTNRLLFLTSEACSL